MNERSPLERRLFALALALALVVLVLVAHPLFVGRVYVDSDLVNFHLPLRDFYARCLERGDSFLWFPNFYNGFYVHGESQAGMLHPLNLLSYWSLPLPVAFDLELLRNYVFLLVGTFLFLRRRALPRDAALFGSLVFGFSSFNFLHFMHLNVVAAAAHLPWLLLVIDVCLEGRSPRRRAWGGLALVGLTTSQLLLGHPQIVWYSVLAEASYVAVIGLRRNRLTRLPAVAAAKLLGALAASVQILPLLESLGNSFRAAPSEEFVDALALHPLNLLQLVAPMIWDDYTFGIYPIEFALYMGASLPLLLLWLAMRWRHLGRWRATVAVALAMAAISLLLSMGERGMLQRVVATLPVVGLFRAPTRYLVLFDLAVSVAAAVALLDLRRLAERGPTPPWRSLWPLSLPLLASIVAASWAITYPEYGGNRRLLRDLAEPAQVAMGPLLVLVATGLVLAAARRRRFALFALLTFIVADQAGYGLSALWQQPSVDLDLYVKRLEPHPEQIDYRVVAPTPLALAGLRLANGYAALIPRRTFKFEAGRNVVERWKRTPMLQTGGRLAGVGRVMRTPVPGALPRARLVTRAMVSELVRFDVLDVDVGRVALVHEAVDLEPGAPGRARIESERPGEIHLRVDAPTRQLLVLAESYHRGWRADAQRGECQLIRVYHDFMGCVVEPGPQQIVLRFEPESWRVGARLSALGGVLALLGFGGAALRLRDE